MTLYELRPPFSPEMHDVLGSFPQLLRELLLHRGITNKDDAERFLKPDYVRDSHDPFLIKNMDVAVTRTLEALKRGEKVAIWSDYDCDGIPGAVLLHDFFKKIGANFVNYIPHRHEEGYGLNKIGIEELSGQGVTLMITVDSGITDIEPVLHAKKLGIDVIVTDHHLPGKTLPEAYAVLNSKQEGDQYPYKYLAGSGVAFKLIQALILRGSENGQITLPNGWEKWLLDMAGLATLADMVPLTGENRMLAYFGLLVLRKSPRLGLIKLCRKMRVRQRELTEDDVGFMVVPRINAASRMGVPFDAFRLLTTTDEVEADELSDHLNRINDERKGVVASMVKEIRKRMENRETNKVIVMGDPRWKPALLGLAANSLAEDYNRPVFLWGREGGNVIKGSCRSDGSVNVVELMRLRRELFIDFGGHAFSGGFSVIHEKIHILETELTLAFTELQVPSEEPSSVLLDGELALSEVNWSAWNTIAALGPYGEGNPKPIFLFPNVEIQSVKQFGKKSEHLELKLARSNQAPIPAIAFFTTPEQFECSLHIGAKVNIVGSIERSTFKNFPELRLRIEDII